MEEVGVKKGRREWEETSDYTSFLLIITSLGAVSLLSLKYHGFEIWPHLDLFPYK